MIKSTRLAIRFLYTLHSLRGKRAIARGPTVNQLPVRPLTSTPEAPDQGLLLAYFVEILGFLLH
jgi:hypothetical protein